MPMLTDAVARFAALPSGAQANLTLALLIALAMVMAGLPSRRRTPLAGRAAGRADPSLTPVGSLRRARAFQAQPAG